MPLDPFTPNSDSPFRKVWQNDARVDDPLWNPFCDWCQERGFASATVNKDQWDALWAAYRFGAETARLRMEDNIGRGAASVLVDRITQEAKVAEDLAEQKRTEEAPIKKLDSSWWPAWDALEAENNELRAALLLLRHEAYCLRWEGRKKDMATAMEVVSKALKESYNLTDKFPLKPGPFAGLSNDPQDIEEAEKRRKM